MRIKKGEIFLIVFFLLTGLFFIVNNLFEHNYISQRTSLSILAFCCTYFILTFILHHYKIITDDEWEESERLIMKQLCVCFVIFVVAGVGLHFLFGTALWIRYVILFLWIVAGCFFLYTSLREN